MDTYHDKYYTGSRRSDHDPLDEYITKAEKRASKKSHRPPEKQGKKYLVIAILVIFGLIYVRGGNSTFSPFNVFTSGVTFNQPSEDLLNRMNIRMVEMGYTDLDHSDLRELRRKGVTATFISNVRGLGFTDITLDDAVRLSQADVSSTFMAMMLELGYDLDLEDFITLRRGGVTAHFTSNVHDLGYRDVTTEQLIRMRRIGVTTSLIERLQSERGEDVELEEIIRYRISNQ